MKQLLAGLILSFAVSAQAEPVITSVASDGVTATIYGYGFGVKSPAKPYLYADMQNGTGQPTADGIRTSWDAVSGLSLTTDCGRPFSTVCAVGTWKRSPLANHFDLSLVKPEGYSTIYVSAKRKFTFSPTSNQKLWRLWANADGSGAPNDFLSVTSNGGAFYNEVNTLQPDRYQSFAGYTPNVWHNEQHIWTHGNGACSGNQGNGTWEYRMDNHVYQQSAILCNGTIPLKHLKALDNFTDTSHMPPDGSKVLMDDLYVDVTTARVMLCNASTYEAATVCEEQLPIAWADEEITAKIRYGDLNPALPLWAYIFDGVIQSGRSDSTPNSNGFLVGQ